MKVKFKTNLDAYDVNHFPNNFSIPPRIGELIMIKNDLISYYRDKKLPLRLEVVAVSWYEDYVLCELWYNKMDFELAKCANVKLL